MDSPGAADRGAEVELTPRTEEFAGHIGLDLNDPADRKHLWLARTAVREPLPEGWSQHEDDEGFLFFYDAILDKSSWEHPQEGYWKRLLEEERRKAVREQEVRSIEEQIATMAEGEEGKKMVRELKARFIKADVAALEVQMQSTRSQVESMQLALMTNAPDEEGRTREQVRKHSERLKKELRQMSESMRGMLSRLERVMRPEEEDEPEPDAKDEYGEEAASKPDVLVTPDAIKEMCEYLEINIYTEPHLIYLAKAALEAPLPAGWVESTAPDGEPEFLHEPTGETTGEHPMDGEFLHQVTLARQKAGETTVSLFSDPWFKLCDQDGVPYYYNFRSDEISFTRPPDSRERAAARIQARVRGIQGRAALERKGIKVVRLEADKESTVKQRLMMQLTQLQLEDELSKDREEAMKARLAEEAARQEEKRLQEEARERERQRVEKEKVAMLEALRLHQEKQEMLAAKLQGVYRAHMVRKRVEMPHHRRERVVRVLQGAYRAHLARAEHLRRIKLQKHAQLGRRKVAAVQMLQRVYRGHVARRVFGGVRAERDALQPQIDAATAIKRVLLCYLYRSAYRAAIYELEQRARQFNQGELEERLKDEGLWEDEGQQIAQDAAQLGEEERLAHSAADAPERHAHTAATDATVSSVKPRTAHMLDAEDVGDAQVMVIADSRPQTEHVTRPHTTAMPDQGEEDVDDAAERGHGEARPGTQYTAPEGLEAGGGRLQTGGAEVLRLDEERAGEGQDAHGDDASTREPRWVGDEGGEEGAADGGGAARAHMSEVERRAEVERAIAAAERASTGGSAMLPSVVSWSPPRTGAPRTAAEEVEAVEGIAPPAPPTGEAMPEPLTMVLDLDFEMWDDVVESMWKKKVCAVATMLGPDDLEVVRVSAGSVVVEAMIYSPLWRDALAVLHADLAKGKEGVLWDSVKALSLVSPLSPPAEPDAAAHDASDADVARPSHASAPAPAPAAPAAAAEAGAEAEAAANTAAPSSDATPAAAHDVTPSDQTAPAEARGGAMMPSMVSWNASLKAPRAEAEAPPAAEESKGTEVSDAGQGSAPDAEVEDAGETRGQAAAHVTAQAAVQVPVLEPLPAEAAAQDDLTGAGADAGAGSERQPTASAREEIERTVSTMLEEGTQDAEAMAMSSLGSSLVGSTQSSARGEGSPRDAAAIASAPHSRPSSARPVSAARVRNDVKASYQRPGSAQSGVGEARRSRPGSAVARPASAHTRPDSAVGGGRASPAAAAATTTAAVAAKVEAAGGAAPEEVEGDDTGGGVHVPTPTAAPTETTPALDPVPAAAEAPADAGAAAGETAAQEVEAKAEDGDTTHAQTAPAETPQAGAADAAALSAEPPAAPAPSVAAESAGRTPAEESQAAGAVPQAPASAPAPGMSYDEAVLEREKARGEAKDDGKVAASAPRDDAAAMEAAMLAAHKEEQEQLAVSAEEAPAAMAGEEGAQAAAAPTSVTPATADLSTVEASHISAGEVTQMAQTVGADFLGSSLLEPDAEGDADADAAAPEGQREASAGGGKAGVSFDDAALTAAAATDKSRAHAEGKDMSMTTMSLGATTSTALSMADTKAKPGDTQTLLDQTGASLGEQTVRQGDEEAHPAAQDDGEKTAAAAADVSAAMRDTLVETATEPVVAAEEEKAGEAPAQADTTPQEEGEEGEEGAEERDSLAALESPGPRPSTTHTRPGTRAATAATDDSALTVQTQHLAGPAIGVVVRSLLNPEGGKGRFKFSGALEPLGKIDDQTLRDMGLQMNLPGRPPYPTAEEVAEHGTGWLQPADKSALIEAIAEDERGRDALCIILQKLARGMRDRAWMRQRVDQWRQQKEMELMEKAIEQMRLNGAATTIQRVTRGHMGRLLKRDQLKWLEDQQRAGMEARWKHFKDNLGREASLITRVAKGHAARNLARMLAADLERERQLAFLDLQAQLDVVGAFEFDAAEDDKDDELEQDDKGGGLEEEDAELDFGDDATPRAVTKWYEKVIFPERHFPYTDESLGTDVNAAAARRIQTVYRARLARLALAFRQRNKRRAQQAARQTAARNIQMAFRQYRVVKGEERRRINSTLNEVRERSATRIQALMRGSTLRIHVARRKTMEEAMRRQRINVAIVTIQSLARGFLERCRAVDRRRQQGALALVFKAAQKIQARWRGVMGRAKMRRVRDHRAKYLGEIARQEQAARDLRVLVLQAVYRGHLGRELYRERLVEVEAHRRLTQVTRRRAALMFQGLWRGFVYRNRRRIQARKVRFERAACKLQRVYRGHLVRNDVNNTKFQLLYGHMATSVTTVANNYRMHVARRRRKEMVQFMFQAGTARFLQAVYRGHLGRLSFRALVHANYRRDCTMLIQRSYKCHVARVLYKDLWQQLHEQSAALTLQRVQRGHAARSTVREFLNKKAMAQQNAMAGVIQRVYRGHLARILARSEKNKLQAQYNMAWLTTYTEQLTRIAKVEHWDVFQGRVENIAHRVRDLYASFDMEHITPSKGGSTSKPATKKKKTKKAKAAEASGDAAAAAAVAAAVAADGNEEGVSSGVEVSEGEEGQERAVSSDVATPANEKALEEDAEEEEEEGAEEGEEGEERALTIEELQARAAREEEEKMEREREHHAAAAVALAPKVAEMLEEMAGAETLKKPWNEGKTARATADLIELAGVTSQIRRNKMARTYGTAKKDAPAEEEAEDTGGVNLSLLLGKTKPPRKAEADSTREVVGHFRTAQVAPDYMKAELKTGKNGAKLVPDAGLGRVPGTDPTSGVLPDLEALDDGVRDVASKYHFVRNRQGMPMHILAQEAENVSETGGDRNKWMADGPVLLTTASHKPHAMGSRHELGQDGPASPLSHGKGGGGHG